ncbi:MAG TPA: heavy metal translocating P-type ATPase [Longimicrobiales bacterium]|nr:heavy metal translocating P-type ATPase [Longimicrobiales bacterium]
MTAAPADGTGEAAPWKGEAVATGVCALAAAAAWTVAPVLGHWAVQSAYVVAYVAGAWATGPRAVRSILRLRVDVDLLMLVAASGAALVGHPAEGAILLILFSLGNTLERYAFHHTRRSIRALVRLRPDTARRLGADGAEAAVPVESLSPGERVRIRPGDRIPVDGVVLEGTSRVDESTLTGESEAARKEPGSRVFAGTFNEGGSLDVEVTHRAGETTLARVIRSVEEARETRAPTQSWLERVEGRYAVGVLAGAGVAAVAPVLFLGWGWDESFFRAMTLLVVASPCALVISIPAAIVSAVSNGARHGILFKGGASLDALASVRVLALDKTGTLTEGRPGVAAVWTGEGWSEDALLRLVAAAESRSEHHLARAVAKEAARRGLTPPEPRDFQAIPGHGVTATVEGHTLRVGRPEWVTGRGGAPPELEGWLAAHTARGCTPVLAAQGEGVIGGVVLQDRVREGAAKALADLRRDGFSWIALLTGDHRDTGARVGREVDVDQVAAELHPGDKVEVLTALRAERGPVAMVGDGVNDAPALAAADVGIAIGAAGTDVALETADLVLMGERLDGLVHARRLALRTRRIVRQNLIFAGGVLVTLVLLALMGAISLTTGVLGHEGSTVIVVLNGLRLLAGGPKG